MCNPDDGIKTTTTTSRNADKESLSGTKARKPLFPAKDPSSVQEISRRLDFSKELVSIGCEFSLGVMTSAATLGFSLWFPFAMAPHAATETYVAAAYNYDAEESRFDNSAWTYGTDYALVVVMGWISWRLLQSQNNNNNNNCISQQLRCCSAALLGLYAISVFAGGWAHQFYLTVESRNTWCFRAWWTLCVGSVSLASGIMGLCGTKLVCGFQSLPTVMGENNDIPVFPEAFWIGFGILQTLVCALGGISYQRPACDIFIAGTTQFPSTFYVIGSLLLRNFPQSETKRLYRVAGYIGFIWNAPLLPMYPLLVQYTNWSLAGVNTLLHGWLLVGWSLQGICLGHCCNAMEKQEDNEQQEEALLKDDKSQ